MAHDYKRHGTTTLFAALNVIDGSVIGRNMQRHRHREFIRFLNAIEAELQEDKTVHGILDNYATHKQPKVSAPSWQGIPDGLSTSSRHPVSGLNAVEEFFAKPTRRRLKHGVFHSVVDLHAGINRFVKEHTAEPKPPIWKADPEDIIAVKRCG